MTQKKLFIVLLDLNNNIQKLLCTKDRLTDGWKNKK